ncbi:hypothetical protein GPJ56_009345 [Histomonas meleagridis]|uniref:uncharacterized protein n=1 Tax=Histomonas meleagridis TaxID=135588 RepID=UPI00355A25BD|nr:hypothetical protein GPJ56_009345 [Histomonas meleagridis]KAH0797297.1 hypothetical protein GO595_009979 [Histomonas meleagridis]
MKLAQEELGHLNDLNKANEWYEAAYNKLSKFTGIEIIDENTLRLLGQYDIRIYNNSIQIIPGDIYIEDIDPSQSTIGVCISEIIERIAALNDFKEITQKLGWNMSIMNDAPIVELSPPLNPNNKALFALIGYETHPLIEWGNVNVEEFNNRNQSLLNKIQAYAK